MNRIEARLTSLRRAGRKGLIVYLGAGDPDLARTCELAVALDLAGADCLELGVPFSDPLADGVVNQLAAQRGLASGTTPRGVIEAVSTIRRQSELPVVLYIYFNLMHRYGMEAFIADAARAGVDGILALDLPPEEAGRYETLMRLAGLCPIYLVAPTTPDDRVAVIAERARGFLLPSSPGKESPACSRPWPVILPRSSGGSARAPICPWRWALGYRMRTRRGPWRRWRMRWWWAARSSIGLPGTDGRADLVPRVPVCG